jgi:hypothetical protein
VIRRLFLAAILLWCGLLSAEAAPAHTDGCITTSTLTCTFVAGVAAGTHGVFAVVSDTGVTVSAFTDTETSSPCTIGTAVDSTKRITPIYCANLAATAKTFVAILSGVSTTQIVVGDSYTGIVSSSPLDKIAGQHQTSPGTGANAITSGSAGTATIPGELVWAVTVNSSGAAGAGTITAGTGFTARQTSANLIRTEDLTQAAAAAVTGTFTSSNSGDSFNTIVMSFMTGELASKIVGFTVLNGLDERVSKIVGFVVLCTPPGTAACAPAATAPAIIFHGPW